MSKSLNEIRKEIDIIDDKVHDLFMRRVMLVSEVAAAKKKEGLSVVHPAREAKLIRRLISRHDGALPLSVIVRIWRELISAAQLLQTDLSVVVASSKYWDMAKNYFGSQIPMKISKNAIADIIQDNAYFAVMPWVDEDLWWAELLDDTNKDLSIICALPYGSSLSCEDENRAIVVSKVEFMPSDEDISFIGLKLNYAVNCDFIIEQATQQGIEVINIYESGFNYLLEIKGFIESPPEFDNCRYCRVIGGYPLIPNINN